MSGKKQDAVVSSVKQSKMFMMQIDEPTDISRKAQLLAFTWFVNDEKIDDQFFCCKKFKGRLHFFDTLSNYLEENGLT